MAVKIKKTPRFKKIWLSFLSVFLLAAMFFTPQVIATVKTAREKAMEFANQKNATESFIVNVTFGSPNAAAAKKAFIDSGQAMPKGDDDGVDQMNDSLLYDFTQNFPLFENPDSALYYQLVFNNKSSAVYKMKLPTTPIKDTTYHVGNAYMNCADFGQIRAVKLFGLNLSYGVEIRNVDVSRVVVGAPNLENWQFYGGTTEDRHASNTEVIESNSHRTMTKFLKGSMAAFDVDMHTAAYYHGGAAYNTQISGRIAYTVQDNAYGYIMDYLYFDARDGVKRSHPNEPNYDPFIMPNVSEKMTVYCRNIKSFSSISFTSNAYDSWYTDVVWLSLLKPCILGNDGITDEVGMKSFWHFASVEFPDGYGQFDYTQAPHEYGFGYNNSITEAPGVADFAKHDVEPQKPGPNKLMDIYVFPVEGTTIEGDIKLKVNWVQTIGNYPVSEAFTLTEANTVDVNGIKALRFVNIKVKDFGNLNSMQISSAANESFPVIDYVLFNLRNDEPNSKVDVTEYADFYGADLSQVREALIEKKAPERIMQTQKISICTENTLHLKDGEDVFVSLRYVDDFGNIGTSEYQSLSKLGVKSFIQGQTTTVDIKTIEINKVTGINLYRTIPKVPPKAEDGTEAAAVTTKLGMVYIESFNSRGVLTARASSSMGANPYYFITTDKKSDDQACLLSDTNVAYKTKIDFKTASELESSIMRPIICNIYLENGTVIAYQLDNDTLLGESKAFVEGTTSSLNMILDSKITSIILAAKLGSGDDLWKLESVSFSQQQLGTQTPAVVVSRTINNWIGDLPATIPLVGDIDIPKVKEEEIPDVPPDPNPPNPNPPAPTPPAPNPPAPNPPAPNPPAPNP